MNDTAPVYLRIGKRRIRIPRRRGVRILLASALLIRGLIPNIATPVFLSASITLFSMDVPRIRRWRRKGTIAVRRWRQRYVERKRLRSTVRRPNNTTPPHVE